MVFATLKAARSELARRKITEPIYRHEIVKFNVHRPDCLYSNGAIVAPYPCTCGGTGEHRYALRLAAK